jgi:choline kinase
MIGIILAAGSGRRLKIHKPKGMLNIAGKPLIQYSVDCLLATGVNEIIIVTGFRSHFYDSYFKNHPNVRLVHNAEYENCGSLWTLHLALEDLRSRKVEDNIVILDSDIIYNYDEFEDFIINQSLNAILATNVPDGRHDACYIEADLSDNLVKVSKNINYITDKDDPWEYIGITKVSKSSVPQIRKYASDLVEKTGSIDHEYDYAFESIDSAFSVCRYSDYIWSEADDNQQLSHLITLVYPKLNLYYANHT